MPQGSVLGLILFLIFINDLEDDLSSKVPKFADDTNVFRTVKQMQCACVVHGVVHTRYKMI